MGLVTPVLSRWQQLEDLTQSLGTINHGVSVQPNGANLNINRNGGELYSSGVGYFADPLNPGESIISSQSPMTFDMRTQTGAGTAGSTVLDVANTDVGGVVTPITGVRWQNFRVFQIPGGLTIIQYGQQIYTKLSDALANIPRESFVSLPEFVPSGILIGIITTISNATELNDTNDAVFSVVGKLGEAVTTAGQGTSDHGALGGLTDDDHTQYLFTDGSRALTGNQDLAAFYTDITEIVSPGAPAAGTRRIFVDDATNELSIRTSAGAIVTLESQGVTDHGNLGGLEDIADHAYAFLHDGARAMTGNFNFAGFFADMAAIVVPANPLAGTRRLFVNTATNQLSVRTSAGATISLEGGGDAQTADGLDQFASTTSAELAGVITDETGTGVLVYSIDPVLTTPQINDASSTHQYIFGISELVADRTIMLPLLIAGDTFVFEDHIQTLSGKTLVTPTIASFVNATHGHGSDAEGGALTNPQINDSLSDHQYIFSVADLAADRIATL